MPKGGGPGNGADRTPIDFVALAASLLERASTLVPQWLPEGEFGDSKKRWYVGDFDGSKGKSANVNLATGAWGDNGRAGDSGKDLLSLYKRVRGFRTMLEAARDLMGDDGWRAAPVAPPKKERKAKWVPVRPVPADAPPYREQWAHYARGVPHAHWEYRDRDGQLVGVVARFNTSDGGKEVQPLSWAHRLEGKGKAWRYLAFGEPRPLYGLWRLGPSDAAPPARVIVVEGEKKADALHAALGGDVPVLSWPGGCKVLHMADWSALPEGTEVLAWPDADAQLDKKTGELLPPEKQPGLAAMLKLRDLLDRQGCLVRVVDTGPPGARADGWDAADAIAEGWTREQLEAFMANQLPGVPSAAAGPSGGPAAAAGGGGAGGASPPTKAAPSDEGNGPTLGERFVYSRGAILSCTRNVALVLEDHAQWRGVLAFDEFSQRVVKRRPAPYDSDDAPMPAEWSDIDDGETALWLTERYGGSGFVPSSSMVAEAANVIAHRARFHPVLDWLRSLRHDGTSRIDQWLVDYFGMADTPYTRKVSRYYLIGMCMRVLKPGCKFDYCLVLEGPQGRLKSSALRVLAGEWFSDTELDLQHKDSMSYIRGKWLHEFGELGSLARAEELRQKSFLSRQVDEFRPTYGRREIRCPRQVVFAGTTNQWQWNKDPTGGRRFWPGEVIGEVDVAALASVRDQLFAEAFALAQQGERYWPTSEEQRELFDPEQQIREAPEALADLVQRWLDKPEVAVLKEFSLADALIGIGIDAKSMTKDVQTRMGICLRKLGCEKVEHREASVRHAYKRPVRKAPSSQPAQPVDEEGEVVPF